MYRVLLIGDSIRQGYQETVAKELEGWAEIWGPEQNGGPSTRILEHLEEWILSREADAVLINCGLHDLKKIRDAEEHQVPIDQYTENVEKILGKIKESGKKVFWAQTTPVNEERHSHNKDFQRFEADVAAYNLISEQIAMSLDIPVLDLHDIVMEKGRDELLRQDGVHYKPEGKEFLGKVVAQFLREQLAAN